MVVILFSRPRVSRPKKESGVAEVALPPALRHEGAFQSAQLSTPTLNSKPEAPNPGSETRGTCLVVYDDIFDA